MGYLIKRVYQVLSYSFVGIALLSLASCGDKSSNNPVQTPLRQVSQLIEASTGGSLTLPNGATLTILPGALSEDSTIKISILNNTGSDLNQPIYIFEPDGLRFNQAASFEFPFDITTTNNDLTVKLYHQSDLNPLLDYGSEQSNWLPLLPSKLENNRITVELNHFSALRAFDQTQEQAYLVFDTPFKYLEAGDVVVTLTTLNETIDIGGVIEIPKWVEPGPNWAPGHIGVVAPNNTGLDRVIEASGDVNVSNEQKFKDGEPDAPHIFLDARRAKGGTTQEQQETMVSWLEEQKGKDYTLIGTIDADSDSFSCASLAATMLTQGGQDLPDDIGIVTPISVYENTEPVRSISVPVGENIELPVYGVVVDPESLVDEDDDTVIVPEDLYSFQYYCKGCQNTISASNLPEGATFVRKSDGSYVLTWTPQEKHQGQSFPIDFAMAATISYGKYSKTIPDKTKNIKDVFTINVLPSAYLDVDIIGEGTVLSVPRLDGIECVTGDQGVCEKYFPLNKTINLNADVTFQHGLDWEFVEYDGDCTGKTCSLKMDNNKKVEAIFKPTEPTKTTLQILDITGQGKITSQPAGIDCGTGGNNCLESYDINTKVTLTPVPELGWRFKEFTGDCTGANACTIRMNKNRIIGGIFENAIGEIDFCEQVLGTSSKLKVSAVNNVSIKDPSGHGPFIFNSQNIDMAAKDEFLDDLLNFNKGNSTFNWSSYVIPINGNYVSQSNSCSLSGMGKGTAAGFQNITIELSNGMLSSELEFTGNIKLGSKGGFPGGQPWDADFSVQLITVP